MMWHDNIIYKELDCYFIDNDGELKILFKLRKNVIPVKMQNMIRNIFEKTFFNMIPFSEVTNSQRPLKSSRHESFWDRRSRKFWIFSRK